MDLESQNILKSQARHGNTYLEHQCLEAETEDPSGSMASLVSQWNPSSETFKNKDRQQSWKTPVSTTSLYMHGHMNMGTHRYLYHCPDYDKM